jgi:mercuric ion transport protein
MTTVRRDVGRFAGGAGVVAATCAALCCAGAPVILSILTATGLGFLRNDAILLPVIALALLIALWGFWRSRSVHASWGPLASGSLGAIALVCGVVALHGTVAKVFIGLGALVLLAATVWNAVLPRACDVPVRDPVALE